MFIDSKISPKQEFRKQAKDVGQLPENVCFIGQIVAGIDAREGDFLEFEVITGNAAYRAGEHFYLHPRRARRVYGLG